MDKILFRFPNPDQVEISNLHNFDDNDDIELMKEEEGVEYQIS